MSKARSGCVPRILSVCLCILTTKAGVVGPEHGRKGRGQMSCEQLRNTYQGYKLAGRGYEL